MDKDNDSDWEVVIGDIAISVWTIMTQTQIEINVTEENTDWNDVARVYDSWIESIGIERKKSMYFCRIEM